ncbi:uncharacterized protein BDV14DRAFT_201874 [Aspergillus stella-maris]|uniref:uncharacterized protein n=1 Tax=Aspergillus stella-maris TaxID=1810926 RepID=UPI003CCCB9BB
MALEIIDPDGDVLITCAGTVTFQVSTKALSLASPVLRGMLKPISEGGLLIKSDYIKEASLNLPLDDAAAFRLLCEVAHHTTPSSIAPPSPESLRHVVSITHKYNCVNSMRDRGRIWLSHKRKGLSNAHLWIWLQFAYLLDLDKLFYHTSRDIICGHREDFQHGAYTVDTSEGPLPERILELLEDSQNSVKCKIDKALMGLISDFSQFTCAPAQAFVCDYVRNLKALNLLPGCDDLVRMGLLDVEQRADDLKERVHHHPDKDCKCRKYVWLSSKADLLARLGKCREGVGLCLACVKSSHCEKHS